MTVLLPNLAKINRVEVINHAVNPENKDFGRIFSYWTEMPVSISVQIQDDGRTMKIFIDSNKPPKDTSH